MGTNTLETAYSNGQIIDASHVNELTAAIINQFVGRNTSGVPESGKSLGTAAIPWGAVHANSLILNGSVVDPTQITSVANRIVSGAVRSTSNQPQFLDADGAAATMTVLGASTNLTLSINASAVTVSTDIVKTGLTLAPAANNTALVNDANIVNDLYAGEIDAVISEIIIDNVGSEITAKVGEFVALRTATGEIMLGFLKNATTITNVYRGFFFDDTGVPTERGNLSDNDTLTLMNIGYVFVEDNATTVDISYIQPVYSFEAPSGPAVGQYWFDIPNQVWKRYSGTEFEIINRILLGSVILDDTAAIAVRSLDFTNVFIEDNNVEVAITSSELIESREFNSKVSVYGNYVVQDLNKLSWNITTDLESGLSEASDTTYYLYLSDKGERVMSDKRPYDRNDLNGFYHPYNTWRCIGVCYNDSSDDLIFSDEVKYNPEIEKRVSSLREIQNQGVDGSSSSAGTYSTRVINTFIKLNGDFVKVDSNQFILCEGVYDIDVQASSYACSDSRLRLQNITDSLTTYVSNNHSFTGSVQVNALLSTRFQITNAKTFELQQYAGVTQSGGLGNSSNVIGEDETYLEILISKVG